MARPLILSLDGQEFSVSILKIDREKLYGRVEIEAFDEHGHEASLKVLAADGKTLIDKGGTALAVVDSSGNSTDRAELTAVDADGEVLEPVESSFGKPNVLKKADADDYLSQLVKSVYLIQPFEDADLKYLNDHLASEQIYTFEFSYRGGLEYDRAYILGDGKDAFMVTGKQTAMQFVKLNQTAVLDTLEEAEISADDIDFEFL